MRKALYILGILDDGDADWLAECGTLQTCEPGQTLVEQGIAIDQLFIVLDGRLSVQVGENTVIANLAAGDIVGEMSFIDSDPPSAFVVANEASQVLAIPRTVVSQRLATDQAFAARLYHSLAVVLSDRLRTTISGLTEVEGEASSDIPVDVQELDEGVLDNIHIAGERMRRILALVDKG